MRTLYHHNAQLATRAYNKFPLLEKLKLPYKQWLADQGAALRLRESDNTWWLDFDNEKEFLMFSLRWL